MPALNINKSVLVLDSVRGISNVKLGNDNFLPITVWFSDVKVETGQELTRPL